MRKTCFVLAACAALASPALGNAPPADLSARDLAGDVVVAFMENFNAGNKEGVASTYSDGGNFSLVQDGRVVNADKASAVADLDKIKPGARMETDNTGRILLVGDNAAEAIVPITYFEKDANGFEVEVFKGVMTLTIAPDTDGTWRIVSGHVSSATGR